MGVKILFILFYTLAMGVTHRLGTAGMKEKRMSASNTMIKNSWSYASTPRKYWSRKFLPWAIVFEKYSFISF